jgi:hypothetical protein
MAGKMKTRLALAGLLAASVASGTLGCTRAEAEARPQELLQQQQDGSAQQDDTEAGAEDTGTLDEPGTSGSRGTGGAGVLDEDEGVLQPGVNDEGLDDDEGQADQDTLNPGTRPQPEG